MPYINYLAETCSFYGVCVASIVFVIGFPLLVVYQRRATLTLEHCALLYHGKTGCRNYVPKACR
jgi:hypothetical protein